MSPKTLLLQILTKEANENILQQNEGLHQKGDMISRKERIQYRRDVKGILEVLEK